MANKTLDYTMEEMMEWEDLTEQPFESLQDATKPRMQKIAFLGHIVAKRDNPKLKFQDYIKGKSLTDVMKDAFGDLDEEEKKEEKTS